MLSRRITLVACAAMLTFTSLQRMANAFVTPSAKNNANFGISRFRATPFRLYSTATDEESTVAAKTGYPFQEVEPKWQKYWEENNTFKTPERDTSKPKKYVLDMFPYPSGAGLHVGHPEGYTGECMVHRREIDNRNTLHKRFDVHLQFAQLFIPLSFHMFGVVFTMLLDCA